MNRRGFLGAMLAAGAAPAIVKAANIMPVFMRRESGLLAPELGVYDVVVPVGNTLLTIDMITKEALRILHKNLAFVSRTNAAFDDSFYNAASLRMRQP